MGLHCNREQSNCNFPGAVLFHFPWETLMAVTHHSCPKQFVGTKHSDRKYVCAGTWDDLEEESHVARRLNLWSQGHHVPPVESSTQDMLASISLNAVRNGVD